ncbi:alpha-E domain-containing protein [Sulfitobacter sp. G21635-S1]|uniref:alpha-E domain-containing protein n=1 Tax=Sulfitobacter sp. G21635-S1 TaxID=3014043 RepID=UPI0022AFDC5A|nr:alpha-E domain-containing protein [Sulfitobacter sp. G21635-S1]MCZ4255031.1 alpha-E domain-containing protein [Sulfitobacter sp. G21635-S1]
MLGKTAGGLYWMFRYLERAENIARLVEAGFRIALTRSNDAEAEWKSVIVTSASQDTYEAHHEGYDSSQVINFLLREAHNPSSVLSIIKAARDNARLTRTALTTEVWYAVNDTWMMFSELLKNPVPETEVPRVLSVIRQQAALVRGALHGTMLRNDIYDFCSLGIAIERMDSTARIIDVKYYSLLPSPSFVGSRLDNVQWETVLRSVSAHRSFRWAVEDDFTAPAIANFLILDSRMPRSLNFCANQIAANLGLLAEEYQMRKPSNDLAEELLARLKGRDIGSIFDEGLHEFVETVIDDTARLAWQIEQDYRFNG